MTRTEIEKDIKDTFGIVPGFLEQIPDRLLETEWTNMKNVQLGEGPVPPKYRQLIGLAQAAATHCRYCTVFHTEFAKVMGATDEEIADTLAQAKNFAGWSTYLNGSGYDWGRFEKEIGKITSYLRKNL